MGIPMQAADKNGNLAAIPNLKKSWDQLDDVDRARAVRKIHKAGTSLRALAKVLNRSESLLRHLNKAAQAPVADRMLARQKNISTRELARRGKASIARNASHAQQALELTRNERAEEVAKAICDLINRLRWTAAFGESVVEEARFYLANAEAQRQIPPPELRDLPLRQLLEQVRPQYKDADVLDVEPYAEWFVKFVAAALPDSTSRHRALSIALAGQSGRT